MPARPKGRCVFCGSLGPLSDEHAIPKWAVEQLGVTGAVTTVRGGKVVSRARKLNVVAPQALCRPCNNVWLGEMESRFKALMGGTLVGRGPIRLNEAEQEFVALWVIKSGLLLELAVRITDPGRSLPIPSSVFNWLRREETPPPNSTVWIGATGHGASERMRVSFFANQPFGLPDGSRQTGNVFTFTSGNLVLKAFVTEVREDEPPLPGIDPPEPATLRQLWPIRHKVAVWPPGMALTYTELDSAEFRVWPLAYDPAAPVPTPGSPNPGFE